MKKYGYGIFCLILSMFMFDLHVYADSAACDYKTKARLVKDAAKITATTEVTKVNGKEVINITVYNVTDDFYIVVRPQGEYYGIKDSFMIYPSMTTDQSYTFTIDNIDTIITYKFAVRTSTEGCTDDITVFTLKKPMKNKHYNMSYCKYKEVADYFYCQEWIDREFGLDDKAVQEKIEKKRDSLTTTTTAYCPSCELEEEQKEREKKVFEIKKYVIAGLSVGIFIDLIVIFGLLRDLKKRGL